MYFTFISNNVTLLLSIDKKKPQITSNQGRRIQQRLWYKSERLKISPRQMMTFYILILENH